MKIPNPWPRVATRCVCRPGNVSTVQIGRNELDIPECDEALIEPIKDLGRGKYIPLGPPKIWSKENGILDLEDHSKKLKIKEEEASLLVSREKEVARRVEEAQRVEEARRVEAQEAETQETETQETETTKRIKEIKGRNLKL